MKKIILYIFLTIPANLFCAAKKTTLEAQLLAAELNPARYLP